MNFFFSAIEYIISLRLKGWGDEGFYKEYDFICLELYKNNHPEEFEKINNMQTRKLLQGEILK